MVSALDVIGWKPVLNTGPIELQDMPMNRKLSPQQASALRAPTKGVVRRWPRGKR